MSNQPKLGKLDEFSTLMHYQYTVRPSHVNSKRFLEISARFALSLTSGVNEKSILTLNATHQGQSRGLVLSTLTISFLKTCQLSGDGPLGFAPKGKGAEKNILYQPCYSC